MPNASTTATRDLIRRYYELANTGRWQEWAALFAPDAVVDEQLAGRIEGRAALASIVSGFPGTYSSFRNDPRHVLVEAHRAAVVSHITATSTRGVQVDAEVANYFETSDGAITYMTNMHDTVPFAPVFTD
ncbi:MAG: nuclear transport factor 2 family protein [Kineosporiaceae bacterium]